MSNKIAIAKTISAEWANAVRLHHPNKEKAISDRIELEKKWCSKCIELGFEKHKVEPADGSKIEYNVIDQKDGSILIESWQDVK